MYCKGVFFFTPKENPGIQKSGTHISTAGSDYSSFSPGGEIFCAGFPRLSSFAVMFFQNTSFENCEQHVSKNETHVFTFLFGPNLCSCQIATPAKKHFGKSKEITESAPVNGEELLGSPELRRQLREAKERLASESPRATAQVGGRAIAIDAKFEEAVAEAGW